MTTQPPARCASRAARPAFLLPVLASLAATAEAALPPQYYSNAREEAPHHLQLRVDAVSLLPGYGSANCEVRATLLRDFRGEAAAGTPMEFTLNCVAPGVTPMPGAAAWHDYATLKDARYAEGFFRGAEPGDGPVYGQLGIVAAERASPWCDAESGSCELPPAAPALVLECRPSTAAGDGAAPPAWRVKIDNARMWYWLDGTADQGAGWRRSIWPVGRIQEPLKVEPERYVHRTARYSEGGEQLQAVRQLVIDRGTLAFEDYYMSVGDGGDSTRRGTCVAAPDPEAAPPRAG
ncbi:MAG: hypothetical protein J7507_06850 [Pseudoxanthomonas sp.]|nr:hypothetical protein [Pseudoxanthomonas sp.]